MDNRSKIKEALLEMFPDLSNKQAKALAATGDDFSVLVTRVLDNNIESPTVSINELTYRGLTKCTAKQTYNYPEIFQSRFDGINEDVEDLRQEANALCQKVAQLPTHLKGRHVAELRTHYGTQADIFQEEARLLNRRAAVIIMRRSLERGGNIDLHGLYVEEAILFLDDILHHLKPKTLVVITGREYNSSRLRPAVKSWFEKHRFVVIDEGPSLRGILRQEL